MKRRSFLGVVGAVVGGGPKAVAKAAIPTDMSSLSTMGLAGLGHGLGEKNGPSSGIENDNVGWATRQLTKLNGLTPWARKVKYQQTYVHSLDPDTASLRSVSLTSKMRISKRIQFEKDLDMQRNWLTAIAQKVIEF